MIYDHYLQSKLFGAESFQSHKKKEMFTVKECEKDVEAIRERSIMDDHEVDLWCQLFPDVAGRSELPHTDQWHIRMLLSSSIGKKSQEFKTYGRAQFECRVIYKFNLLLMVICRGFTTEKFLVHPAKCTEKSVDFRKIPS